MTARLLACPACARHVRVDETRCPFCRVALPGDFGAGPAPVPPPRGLSRAELRRFKTRASAGLVGRSLAVASTLLAAGCSSSDGDYMPADAYGAPDHLAFDGGRDAHEAKPDAARDVTSSDAPRDSPTDATADAPSDVFAPGDAQDGGGG
jgi:hypothetical protein